MKKTRGYSLIEVLIVLAILAAVVLLAAPLSGTWIADANIQESEGQLKEAIGKAKSIALRNQMMAQGDAPVAAICIDTEHMLTVRKGATDTPPSCAATPAGEQVWQAQINKKVVIKNAGTALSCLCFNNKGLVTKTGTCTACAGNTTFILNVGSGDAQTFAIY